MIWMIKMSHPLAKRTVRYDIFCQWSRLSGWAGMFQSGRRGKKTFCRYDLNHLDGLAISKMAVKYNETMIALVVVDYLNHQVR